MGQQDKIKSIIPSTKGVATSNTVSDDDIIIVTVRRNNKEYNYIMKFSDFKGKVIGEIASGSGSFNTINEFTEDTGVTIDGVLIKDNSISINGGAYRVGIIPVGTPESVSIAGALDLTKYLSQVSTGAGNMALTLADGTIDGQLKKIRMSLDGGGNAVVTPDSFGVLTDWTATAEGDTIVLMWSVSAGAWILNDIIGGQLS